MKKLFLLTLAACLALLPSSFLYGQTKHITPEQRAVQGMLLHCVPILITMDEERIAEIEKFPRVPPASEAFYLKGKGGKVFYLPGTDDAAVLVTYYQAPICSVAMRQVDTKEFLKQVEMWFGSTTTFKLVSNSTAPDGIVYREYKGTMGVAMMNMVLNLRPTPSANGVQAMMTAARLNNNQ